MENENVKNAQLNTVDEYGSSTSVYPATTAANVAIAPTPQIDENATILQELLWKLKNAATYSVNDETDDPEEDDKVLWSAAKMKEYILESTYPIGSIYMSVDNTNPSKLFGGTWEPWGAGRFPMAVLPDEPSGRTGGNTTVTPSGSVGTTTLNVNQMPVHAHTTQELEAIGNPSQHYYYYYPEMCQGISGKIMNLRVAEDKTSPYVVPALQAPSGQPGAPSPAIKYHTSTHQTGGTQGHSHTLNMSSISVLPTFITCYMWKRVYDPVEPEEVEENPPQQER